jgi:hypothetical protein
MVGDVARMGRKSGKAPSVLKKRSKRLLRLRRSHLSGHVPDLSAGTRGKSLLVLFFRKEHLSNRALKPHAYAGSFQGV